MQQPPLPKRSRMMEFAFVVFLIGTFGFFLLRSLIQLQDEAERSVVEQTIRNMNSGLYFLQAERITSGREDSLPELAGQNPVNWLEKAPDGYIGEQDCARAMAAGQWCWDQAARTLYYWPKQKNWLKNGESMPWLTWRVFSRQHRPSFLPGSLRLQEAAAQDAATR